MVLVAGLLAAWAGAEPVSRTDGAGEKIHFDLNALDEAGLFGPPDGLRALDYEFCIPDRPDYVARVQAIDPSLRTYAGSRGRVGCTPGERLCLGNTHQPGYRGVLEALAALPYVTRIEQAFFE
jgi:hypothetical protein